METVVTECHPFVKAMREVEVEDFIEFAIRAKTIIVSTADSEHGDFPEFVEELKKQGIDVIVSPYIDPGRVYSCAPSRYDFTS